MKLNDLARRSAAITSVFAVAVTGLLLLGGGARWALGGGDQEGPGKDSSATRDENGRRREDPPTPVAPAVDEPNQGAEVLTTRARALGFDEGAIAELLRAAQAGDAQAVAGLLAYSQANCSELGRNVAATVRHGRQR